MQNLKIERMDHQGRGIAFLDGKITFIPNTLVGEEVEAEIIENHKNYNVAKLNEIKLKSSKRVESDCKYFKSCGGCALRNLKYEDTLLYKKDKVINILNLNKINYPDIKIIENECKNNYRNKVTFKIVNKEIGLFREDSHDLVEINECLLANNVINKVLKVLPELNIINGEVVVRVNYNDEVLIIINTLDKIDFKIDIFKDIKLVGIVVNNKTIYGDNFFYERINNSLFKVSYDAFFQVNPFITKKLFEIINNCVKEDFKVLDLYSGVGTLSIIASKKARLVYSVEVVKNAVLDAIFNCKLNKVNNIKSFLGKTKDVVNKITEDFDLVIVDPPRSGIEKETLDVIMNNNIENMVYVSCDPLTLARDLKTLQDKYEIEEFSILDMFSYTYHIECICVLKLK